MKKLKKQTIMLVITATIMLQFTNVFAAPTITADITATSRNVAITGQIQNAAGENQVALLVGDINNIIYIEQTTSNTAGAFTFNFVLPESFPIGTYPYKIGSDSGATVYSGIFTYKGAPQTRKFADAQVNITLENYVPKINGTVICGRGKNITLNITNTTDNTIIASDTIAAEDGMCNISYTLPSLVSAKDYTVSVVCNNTEKALATMDLSVNSSIILVSASGTITTADGVFANARLESTASDLVNENTTVSGTKSVSGTLPNVLANASYDFTAECFEEYYPTDEAVSCTIMSGADSEVKVVASARNITTFDGRTFELNYDPTQLEAVSLWGMFSDDETGVGRKDNVNIISHSDGKIVFEIKDTPIPEGKVFNGLLNIFKFKVINTDTSVTPTITLK